MDLPNPCGRLAPGHTCDSVCCEAWAARREELRSFSEAPLECCRPDGNQTVDGLADAEQSKCSVSEAGGIVGELNRRWASASAGVVMHGYDGTRAEPRTLEQFMRGHLSSNVVSASMVSWRAPFFFKGITNKLLAGRPATGHAGFVIAERNVRNGLLCSYPTDGCSALVAQRTCAGWRPGAGASQRSRCVPGCVGLLYENGAPPPRRQRLRHSMRTSSLRYWCEGSHAAMLRREAHRPFNPNASDVKEQIALSQGLCARRPQQLRTTLALQEQRIRAISASCAEKAWEKDGPNPLRDKQWAAMCRCLDRTSSRCCQWPDCPFYNELVLDAEEVRTPRAIEAVYFLDARASSSNASFAAGERAARALHQSLVARTGSSGCMDDAPPLVVFAPFLSERAPFALAAGR
jgi:hypothetical protein